MVDGATESRTVTAGRTGLGKLGVDVATVCAGFTRGSDEATDRPRISAARTRFSVERR
jgi:hypothetical protein